MTVRLATAEKAVLYRQATQSTEPSSDTNVVYIVDLDESAASVRFAAHYGANSDIELGPKSATGSQPPLIADLTCLSESSGTSGGV
jgi:hypothetical protein